MDSIARSLFLKIRVSIPSISLLGSMMNQASEYHALKDNHWLPTEKKVCKRWIDELIEHVDANPRSLNDTLQAFKELIEGDKTTYMLCNMMFREAIIKTSDSQHQTPQPQVRNYVHLLQLFNNVMTQSPSWTDLDHSKNLIGAPFNLILDRLMATPSGWKFFVRPDVNRHLKAILKEWALYLDTPDSTNVLNSRDGWLANDGLAALEAAGNNGITKHSFTELYKCPDPTNKDTFGFASWDAFFTREFQPGIRPIHATDDSHHQPGYITNPCESAPRRLERNVQLRSRFWLKAQPYSLLEMLNHNPLASQFSNGTVYQAYLSALSYHRWHAPVSGRVARTYCVDGTYFSQKPPEPQSSRAEPVPDPLALEKSQSYLASVATRAIIFIEADDPRVGLMCFVAVGMAEVSSCEIKVREGMRVSRGDQIGMFHYGGSTHCLVFRPQAQLRFVREPPYEGDVENNVPVCSLLALC